MKYTFKKLENKNIEIEISLDTKEWEEELELAYNANKGKFSVEGFRKGKAPRRVIESVYGSHIFIEDAISQSFYKNYQIILEAEKDIDPVDAPTLSIKSMDEKGVVIVAEVVVKPEVKLNKYTGLKIEVSNQEITDEMVEKELEHIRQHHARLVEVENGKVEMGNVANIDFEGSIDGKLFDGGTSQGFDLEIGSHSFIDTFEEQLVGLSVGEEKEVVVNFPENYHAKELAGKPAVFKTKVNTIKQKVLPEINDEFASDVSEFETLVDYKKSIKEKLQTKAEESQKQERENRIIDGILENMEVEIPECMIESELEDLMKDMEYRLGYQGLKLEDYAKYMGITVEQMKKDRKEDAVKSVKVRLALQEIVSKEKLAVTDSEVTEKVAEMAKSAKKTTKEFKESLSEQRMAYIKNDILMNKLLAFLLENNK